ncbi:DNA repair protein RecO [bacterium]|nr:DNA repair protein RecO [bacterium]
MRIRGVPAVANTVRSEALVLRRFRHGETSLVVHAFTREYGRVPFIAKGARAGGKRPPVPLVPVVLLEFLWAPSTRSELQLLRDTSLLDSFGSIHDSFESLVWAQAALEVLARVLADQDKHETLFQLTLDYFRALGASSEKAENLFITYRLRVLEQMGYRMETSTPEGKGTGLFFLPAEGRAVQRGRDNATGLPLDLGAWKLLSMLDTSNFETIRRVRLNKESLGQIRRVLDAAYGYAFERWKPLDSLKLLNPTTEKHGNPADTRIGESTEGR